MSTPRGKYYAYIKENISIKEVCDKLGIVTREAGNDYVCSCIFHNDSNPSMHIYSEGRNFYCYGCHESGDLFSVIKKKRECSFQEGVKWLEHAFPWILEKKPVLSAKQKVWHSKNGYEIAYEVYKNMDGAEREALQKYAATREYAVDFLVKRDIFFAKGKKLHAAFVQGGSEFIEELDMLRDVSLLNALPLLRGHKSVHYDDYFKEGGIIITLRNERGEVVGFAGRSIRKDKAFRYRFTKKLPKSHILYRLDYVQEQLEIKDGDKEIYIVEGMFDALRLEAKGFLAVAVMGSRLQGSQDKLLGNAVGRTKKSVYLRLFFDSDEAGFKGAVASIGKIWKNPVLRHCYLSVAVCKVEGEDPDEAYKAGREKSAVSYLAFEYLLRYYVAEGEYISQIPLKERISEISAERRIRIFQAIEDMLTQEEWENVFEWYDSVLYYPKMKEDISDGEFAFLVLRQFILSDCDSKSGIPNKGKAIKTEQKDHHFQMMTALQIARTSYEREDITLEGSAWERIGFGADAFFDYFYQGLCKGEKIGIPMITMQLPKKLGVQRLKALYCHEELVLQQYVMNELLSGEAGADYEKLIPAVRYHREQGTYLTGYGYWNVIKENVSFAYQIDMSAINGAKEIKNGMFRPFYDCWKSYIAYIQEGIERLNGEKVYRIKLDIQGFYDHIRRFVIRDALYPSLLQALRSDESKFACFRQEENLNYNVAEKAVNWILDELYEEEYYDAATGILKKKAQYDCGIPQGPALSSYAANISLFSLDKMVWEMVEQANRDCENGRINARYARYVDDMIIIASSPVILMEIKAAIAAHLYDIQLSLSPKTEAADGITKEEANEWTLMERGGFGVSALSDMPEDTIDSLMEEYEVFEETDRRGALKLLQSNLYSLLYEGVALKDVNFERLLKVVFQTTEIRYQDVVRFSEMMIFYAAKEEGDFVASFQEMWQRGVESSPRESLLREPGLGILVLLEGICRILKHNNIYRKNEVLSIWAEIESKVKAGWGKIVEAFEEQVSLCGILKDNRWVLGLKILEIASLAGNSIKKDLLQEWEKNEYWYRWNWNMEKGLSEQMNMRQSTMDLLQDFQYCLMVFMNMQKQEDYREIKSIFKRHRSGYGNLNEVNAISACFKIWFFESGMEVQEKSYVENALRVLLNTLPVGNRAEVIGGIDLLKKYLFHDYADEGVGEFLPIFSGVKYPGIMRMKRGLNSAICGIQRVDFDKNGERNVLVPQNWTKIQDDLNNNLWYYENTVWEKEVADGNLEYVLLSDYCEAKDGVEPIGCLRNIYEIYPLLCEEIIKIMKGLEKEEERRRLLLSKKNVFLLWDGQTKKVSGIKVGSSYLVSANTISDVVGIEKGEEKYELKYVHEDGSAYWIAGNLLKDACHIEKVLLAEGTEENKNDTEMLNYTVRRICGASVEKYGRSGKAKASYQKSMERTIRLLGMYLENEAQRGICLLNARIVNSFIADKLENEPNWRWDASLFSGIWAKDYLRKDYRGFLSQLQEREIRPHLFQVKRRVPKLYCSLADGASLLAGREEVFDGLMVLSAGLYADGILMYLRMQVLEYIRSFEREQRERLIAEARQPEADFPMQELGLKEKTLLLTRADIDLNGIYISLLEAENNEKRINYITHFGWMALLAKVCEIDKVSGFITEDRNLGNAQREKIAQNLKKICKLVGWQENSDEKMYKKTKLGFPFEGLANLFEIWAKENVLEIINCLQDIDKQCGIEVALEKSEYYGQIIQGKRVRIVTETEKFQEMPYFCTFAKRNDNLCDVECDAGNVKKYIYSIAKRRGKVVGVSTIDQEFGKILQLWENGKDREGIEGLAFLRAGEQSERIELSKSEGKDEILEISQSETGEKSQEEQEEGNQRKQELGETEEKKGAEQEEAVGEGKGEGGHQGKENQGRMRAEVGVGESDTGDKNEKENKKDELLEHIKKVQEQAWGCRKNNKFFSDMHRIALFQFRIDSSYRHPSSEKCELDSMAMSDKEGGKGSEGSCAEFRRRKLLEKVLEVCEQFGVEILILPEYSMRPETVEWLREEIEGKEEYNLSIWAGTYRIPVGYDFSGSQILDGAKFNNKIYWHSAPLPIIMKGSDGNVNIIMKKFKKYPAVALHEDINPVPAYDSVDTFRPVMHQYAESQNGKSKCIMPFYYDIRDHVIELICAEFLVMAAISNYPSFLKESLWAYAMYRNHSILESKEVYKKYEDKILKDIQRFGEYTALYQRKSQYLRTPVLLIPACTSRTVDYYVFGQGFYLAVGLKTVLCNAVGTGGNGGSCFIGQDSWDNKKAAKNEYLMANTLYHTLKPGIYMQNSDHKDRGALGEKEQALLICDVSPEKDKKRPNAESMLDALSIVAHIPIFEEKISKEGGCRNCKRYEKELSEGRQKETRKELEDIINHCDSLATDRNMQQKDREDAGRKGMEILSYDDGNVGNVVKDMISLGKKYDSEWFVRRAESYAKYYKMYPQAWIPPTLTDWLYVELDYQEFFEKKEEYCIQMPKKD